MLPSTQCDLIPVWVPSDVPAPVTKLFREGGPTAAVLNIVDDNRSPIRSAPDCVLRVGGKGTGPGLSATGGSPFQPACLCGVHSHSSIPGYRSHVLVVGTDGRPHNGIRMTVETMQLCSTEEIHYDDMW